MGEDTTRLKGRRAPVRRGAVLVWVGILLFVFIGLLGLAVDWGYTFWTAQKLQNAADAAALAGAQEVWSSPDDARAHAIAIAADNEAGAASLQLADNPTNDPDGDIVIGHYDANTRLLTPTLEAGQTNAVLVRARRTTGSLNGALPLIFGGIFGVANAEVTRWGIAVAQFQPAGPGILLLKSNGVGLQHSGDGNVTIHGTVHINSPYNEALHQSGAGTLQAESYDVVGEIYDSKPGGLPGDWNEGEDPRTDPYAGVPVPDIDDTVLYPVRSTSKYTPSAANPTLEPGRYIGGIELNGNQADYVLEPGVYIIEGGGFKVGVVSPGSVTLNQVMIYNTGTNDTLANADQFYISADSTITWTPIVGGVYDQFGLFYNRQLADKKIEISGNGGVNISAIIYGKSAEVQLSGNGETDVLGGGFVAASMQISGNGDFEVGGNSNTRPGGQSIYLAE